MIWYKNDIEFYDMIQNKDESSIGAEPLCNICDLKEVAVLLRILFFNITNIYVCSIVNM